MKIVNHLVKHVRASGDSGYKCNYTSLIYMCVCVCVCVCISFKFVFPFDENVYCENYRIKLCSSSFWIEVSYEKNELLWINYVYYYWKKNKMTSLLHDFLVGKIVPFFGKYFLLQNFCFFKKLPFKKIKSKHLSKIPTIGWRKWMQLFVSHMEANNVLCNDIKGVVNCIKGSCALIDMNAM